MRVVVVGAGLSGLTLASFLRRLNVDCVVLEEAPFLQANYITPYTLYANALSCFKAFGMDYLLTHGGVEPERYFGIKDPHQRWLLKVKNRDVHMKALGVEDVIPLSTAPAANSESIVSQRLAEQTKMAMGDVPLRTTVPAAYIREALRRHVAEIKFGCRVVDLVPHDGIKGGVYAVLEDGSMEWGDVVVGADGMHSTIRRLLYPAEYIGTNYRSLGTTQIDGFVDAQHCPAGLEYPVELWGRRRVLSCTPQYKHGDNCIAFSATLYEPPQALVELSAAADAQQGLEVLRRILKEEFSAFGAVAPLLATASLAVPTEALEVPIMPRWYNKRAVLMGEAAHGSLPSFLNQDASLCVEDAALLATALADVPLYRDSGFEYAFRQFETVRRDRIERYIRQSRRARNFTATRHVWLRDAVLRATPSLVVGLSQKWLANWSYSAQQLAVDPKIKMETAFR